MDKLEVLKTCFGYDSFREGQEEIIDNIISGRDTLGVMPTGAGKSLCYQIPALMFEGITLVISPLISLMRDQVINLVGLGIKAAYINSSLTPEQYYTVIKRASEGAYKLIYIAPERLDSEVFLKMACNAEISMVTVDEAHCISQWGQDFRPSYLKIPEFISRLSRRPTVTAFTATATEQVRDDIRRLLDMRSPFETVTGFDRKNLYFEVRHPKDKYHDLLGLIRKYNAEGRSGIVYCSTRKDVENLCEKLSAEGLSVSRYHAGLTESERHTNQDDFLFDRVRIMCATNAFGMGIDKSNVSFVIHYGMPKDMESYYQEAGRAGRDGSPSDCILLYAPKDRFVAEYLIEKSYEDSVLDAQEAEKLRQRDLDKLRDMVRYCNQSGCLRSYMLRYFGEKGQHSCSNCSYCCSDETLTDITTDSQKIMSCIFRSGQKYGMSTISKVLTGDGSDTVTNRGLDDLPTFGIMSDSSRQYIYDVCHRLTEMGYTEISDDEYRIMKLTQKALPVLRGEIRINARIHLEKTHETKTYDTELFARLQELRANVARMNGVPPYSIFTDSALYDMAAKQPLNTKDFARISGVTRIKAERFADKFIEVIAAHTKKKKTHRNDISGILDHKDRMKESKDDLTVSAFSEMLLKETGCSIKPSRLRTAMTDWLISNGFLQEITEDGHKSKAVTDNSGSIGIYSVHKVGSGLEYDKICYTPSAQRFIIDNMDKIAAAAVKGANDG